MKKRLFFLLSILWIGICYSQSDSLNIRDDFSALENKITVIENTLSEIEFENAQIQVLEKSLKSLKYELRKKDELLSDNFLELQNQSKSQIDSLQNIINLNAKRVVGTTNELDIKIESAENSADTAIAGLGKSVSNLFMYLLIVFLFLVGLIILVFVLLSKKRNRQLKQVNESLQKSKDDLDQNIVNTRDLIMIEIKANKKAIGDDLKNTKINLETHFKITNEELGMKSKVSHEALSEKIEIARKSMTDSIEEHNKTLTKDLLNAKKTFKADNSKLGAQINELIESQLKRSENNTKE